MGKKIMFGPNIDRWMQEQQQQQLQQKMICFIFENKKKNFLGLCIRE